MNNTHLGKSEAEQISYREFLKREENFIYAPYQPEIDFYNYIKEGNVEKTSELCKETLMEKKGLGKLSDNPLQNMKYHCVISIAEAARYCIRSGLPHTDAYSMSDYYIQRVDSATSFDEISQIHNKMAIAYAKKMRAFYKDHICSRPVIDCINFIYEHLHTRITMEDLCLATGLSSAYISRIFKKETGYTVSGYILQKKLETAKTMLISTDYSIAQISEALAFPSQSYFSNAFKKAFSDTPKHFRLQPH